MSKAPIPYITTLDEIYESITEGIFPFITFSVRRGENNIISHVTIPWCRFREIEGRVFEIRSCDCEGKVCGHPPQKMYMSKNEMKNWYFDSSDKQHYTFIFRIDGVLH